MWDSKSKVKKELRPHLFMLLIDAMYAKTEVEFETMNDENKCAQRCSGS